MSDKDAGRVVIGCVAAAWSLFVTTPLFVCVVFAIMQAVELPTWAWVCFWVYVPATVLGLVMAAAAKAIMEK